MTNRERIIRALTMKKLDRIPWEGLWESKDEYERMVVSPPFTYGKGRSEGEIGKKGKRTDAWGSIWEAKEDGVIGEVKDYPIAEDYSNLPGYMPPYDILDEADLSKVDSFCENTDNFCMNFWEPTACSPFQRMQYLRGTENLMIDLALDEPNVYRLRDMVHDFYMRSLKMWCETKVDAIHIEDDWGSQISLLISPKKWREFYKPLYKEYCDTAHSHGKYVVMHSDGYIMDIIEDLIEIGVDAVNSQIFVMDLDELNRRFGGRICFWGEIDRQFVLPFGTEQEIRDCVQKVAAAFLKDRSTGLIAMCPDGKDITYEAQKIVYSEWKKISGDLFEGEKNRQ